MHRIRLRHFLRGRSTLQRVDSHATRPREDAQSSSRSLSCLLAFTLPATATADSPDPSQATSTPAKYRRLTDVLLVPRSSCTGDDCSGSNTSGVYLQDLWFIVLGVFVVLFVFLIWVRGRRRKANIARQNQNRQHALNRDVERMGWTARPHRPTGWRLGGRTAHRPEEGLDETGEAPPAYNDVGDDKPPSITLRNSLDGEISRGRGEGDLSREDGHGFELQSVPASHQTHPPLYDQPESTSRATQGSTTNIITRPGAAVLAAETGGPDTNRG
ncbi:MAG: hypothetical protein M1818_006460 [Claussenomyces sp. TS43310]|nr:MAG: hypothetical protein M1818_006460 [Claussenomyces sp. TS43310]